jgi:ATPase MipZ
MVREARRQRREFDGRLTDWNVVRNRLSALGSRNKRLVGEGLSELASRMGFRWVDGFSERVIYREFFPRGLTALDDLDQATLGKRPNKSHVTARDEVIALLMRCICRCPRTASCKQPPARNGIQSRTSRCKSMTSSAKVRPYRENAGHGMQRARAKARKKL